MLLSGPAADCPLLAPALREPAAAGQVDAVTRRVSTALGESFSVVTRGAGRAEASGRTRYGVFYSRNASGLADRVEIYPLEPARSAPRLLRGPIFRGVQLAVPISRPPHRHLAGHHRPRGPDPGSVGLRPRVVDDKGMLAT